MLTRTILIILALFSLMASPFYSDQGFFKANMNGLIDLLRLPAGFSVEFYPVAPYHVGDVISIRVTYRGAQEINGKEILVSLSTAPAVTLQLEVFSGYSNQAVFYWVLDTAGFEPGFIKFIFRIPAMNLFWTSGINLLPTPPNREVAWETVKTRNSIIHTISGSDAAQDIEYLQSKVEDEVSAVLRQFFPEGTPQDFTLENPLMVYLVPVVVGHGGFAADEAVLTYMHRNWIGGDFATLLHHEMVHVMDRQLNAEGPRPTLLSEGLAVYLSGGHYQGENLIMRAAALYQSDMYLPLREITDDFYAAQHETSYLEAGALVAYLMDIWGWETFIDFYFNLPEGENDSQIISSSLEDRFDLDLAELESNFTQWLQTYTPSEIVQENVRLTIEGYDAIRRYQALVIPSAHFRTAWWPPIEHMQEKGIIGGYAFREKSPVNIIIENQFIVVHEALKKNDIVTAQSTLEGILAYLDKVEGAEGVISHYAIDAPLPLKPAGPIKP